MNISNESFPQPKINSISAQNLNIEENKIKRRIKNSLSVKQLNNIPLELVGTFKDDKKVKTSRTPRKKITPAASYINVHSHTPSSILNSPIRNDVSTPSREIEDFSLIDQMKMLNKIFPNEMKNSCNKVCCNENRSKYFCAICQSEIQFLNTSNSNPDFVFVGGYFYHLKCLKCTSCSAKLNPPFYIEKSSKIYCHYCWFNRKSNLS